MLEEDWPTVSQMYVYVKHTAIRPRTERLRFHGLFGEEDGNDLKEAMAKLNYSSDQVPQREAGEMKITIPKAYNSSRTMAILKETIAFIIEAHEKHSDTPTFNHMRFKGVFCPVILTSLPKPAIINI